MLSEETKKSPHIGSIASDLWRRFPHIWVATVNGSFVGVCVVFPLNTWVKLGPLLVLEQYQGNGYGKRLLTHVAHQYLVRYLFMRASYVYLLDALRKNLLFRRGEYRYFLKL